jgi:hypothetical protein
MIGGNVTPLARWGLPMPGMFLCAGPCSAEPEGRLRQTAAVATSVLPVALCPQAGSAKVLFP